MTDKPKNEEPTVRRFRAVNSLVMPQGLITAPGATNMRLDPGQIVTLDPEAIQMHERFVNGRVRAGDLEELVEEVVERAVSEPASRRKLGASKEEDKEGGSR